MKVRLSEKMRVLFFAVMSMASVQAADYTISDASQHVSMSEICDGGGTSDSSIDMSAGELVADKDVRNLHATGGLVRMQDVAVGGKLEGTVSVYVDKGKNNKLDGDNSYSGNTEITGSKVVLSISDSNALGRSTVYLSEYGELNVNGYEVNNNVVVRPGTKTCKLSGASCYKGDIHLDGGSLRLKNDTTANKVTMSGAYGYFVGGSITLNTLEVLPGSSYIVGLNMGNLPGFSTNLTVNPNGQIVMYNGKTLNVTGSLTLGSGTTFVLNGSGYEKGTVLVTATEGITDNGCKVVMADSYGMAVIQDGKLVLSSVFYQPKANVAAINNWGIVAASRAFVDAVRGQHAHAACMGNGRGTIWAAVLGGYQDIGGTDVHLNGAAAGADVQIGRSSCLGVALGYVDGDVQPVSLPTVEQTGTYVAVYGLHTLKKLSRASSFNLDWVAACGKTESEVDGEAWEQDSMQLNTRMSWNRRISERFCVSVFGGLEYFASNADTINAVKSGSVQNLRGELGLGADYCIWQTWGEGCGKGRFGSTPCDKLLLHAEFRYMNDMVRSNPVIRMDGLSGSGVNPGRSGAGIETGVIYRIGNRWSASVNYVFTAMDDSREHRVNMGTSYTF